MTRTTLLLTALVLSSLGCEWTPPATAVRMGGDAIPYADLACPDRIDASSQQCLELSRLKMRRILFDRMLEQAAATSDIHLTPNDERQIEGLLARIAPSRERYAEMMRCHAMAALQQKGEEIESDPECAVDPEQVSRLSSSLSARELRELADASLLGDVAAAQEANLRAELLLRKVRNVLQETDRSEPEFWRETYHSLDPVFYDANLQMGPAEVITGDSAGWSGDRDR